jgi:predicted MFS family arabinose efflux permease
MADKSNSATRSGAAASVAAIAFGLVAVGIGVDLVLPAVPSLPARLGGTTATAQFVLAGYVAGAAVGPLVLGWAADHVDRRAIFIWSLAAFAVLSLAGAFVGDIHALIALRVLQGAASSGPYVVTVGMVRSLFNDSQSVRAMGFLGSVQSLVPAIAPIPGAWLAATWGWAATFLLTGFIAAAVFAVVALAPHLLPGGRTGGDGARGTYRALLVNAAFLKQAIGYALVLGGLIVFVFAAPAMIVNTMGGTVTNFVVLQVIGISTFIASANLSGSLMTRFGADTLILAGTLLAFASGLGFLLYALAGGNSPWWLIPIWLPMNIGMGLRGPAGYVAAIKAAGSNDARASAVVSVFATGVMAAGTAAVAPFLAYGLAAVALGVVVIIAPAVALLFVGKARAA